MNVAEILSAGHKLALAYVERGRPGKAPAAALADVEFIGLAAHSVLTGWRLTERGQEALAYARRNK